MANQSRQDLLNPHFYQTVLAGFHTHLSIPADFISKHLKGRNDRDMTAKLKSDLSDITWLVKVDGLKLTDGWTDFASVHNLQTGDILVFRHEREMMFHVTAFGQSCCETQYASLSSSSDMDDISNDQTNIGNSSREKRMKENPIKKVKFSSDHSRFVTNVSAWSLSNDQMNNPLKEAGVSERTACDAAEIASRLRKRKSVMPSDRTERKRHQPARNIPKSLSPHQAKFSQDYDVTRFNSLEAKQRYVIFSRNKSGFLEEKNVVFDDGSIKRTIESSGMLRTVTEIKPFISEIVWEFWANLPREKVDSKSINVLVRGWVYEFSPARINELYGLENTDDRGMATVLVDDLAKFMTGEKVKKWSLVTATHFTKPNRELYKICCRNWYPSLNNFYLNPIRAQIVYNLVNQIPFNLGKLVYDHILHLALSPESKFYLPFPSLVFQLLTAQHPITLDSKIPTTQDIDLKKSACKQAASSSQNPVAASSRILKTASSRTSTAKIREAMRLAIKILQDALDAGGR